jgi:hypothetical protein
MRRVLLLLLSLASLQYAEDGTGPLSQIRRNIAAQLARSANYTCVETLERAYYLTKTQEVACRQPPRGPEAPVYAQDRLRLDVAVSEQAEIYSWHGESHFVSSDISSVVQGGPISSGGFVGFLHNIFVAPGVIFQFHGKSAAGGVESYEFGYMVPLKASFYRIRSGVGRELVPYHGVFKADAASLELTEMTVIADDIPKESKLCAVSTDVKYQLARISGFKALIPASFDLRTGSDQKLYTQSHAEYLSCREFRSESTLHFSADDEGTSAASQQVTAAGTLPAGTGLRLALRSDLNDRISYAGDAVDAVLLRKIVLKDSGEIIPAGAQAHGVITKLETHFEPERHIYLRIEFQQLVSRGRTGSKIYTMRAIREPGDEQKFNLHFLFNGGTPPAVISEVQGGSMILPGHRFHLGSRYSGDWVTVSHNDQQGNVR